MLADIELMAFHGCPVALCRLFHPVAEPRNSLYGIECELVAIEIIQHHHIEGCRGGTLLLVTAHMEVVVIVPAVGELMNHGRIAMEGKDHRLVGGEQLVEILVFQTMRMLR